MPLHRTLRLSAFVAALALVGVACGGDADDPQAESPAVSESIEGASAEGDSSADTASENGGGRGTVTVDGDTMSFRMGDIVHSQIDGIDDVTFETCNPSFFGAGFNVIGYAVDANDELILDGDGGIAGTMRLIFPLTAADEAATGAPEFELAYSSKDLDHDLVPIGEEGELVPGSSSTWTVDGSTITGSLVLANLLSEAVVAEFDVSCG